MKFDCYTEWDQLPESANVLFELAEKDSIFFSRPWFEGLAIAALKDDHTMVLACVVEKEVAGDKVLAILPLMKSVGNVKTWNSLRHGFTPLFSLLLADENQERVLACLSQGLSQLSIRGLLLQPVADDDDNLNGLQQAMETVGFHCDHTFRLYNWIYRVQGKSYDEYMAARPARLRNTISRKKRKLDREHGFEIRLFTGDEVPLHMPDYYVAYTASWKANEQYANFQDSIVAGFSKKGWSRLAILYIKGQPVAAQIWFVHHRKASIFRLAYDKAWRQYSPGSILTSFLMEYVIDTDKVEEIDFLTGNDVYKQEWMSERRERFVLGCIKRVKPESKYERFVESLKSVLKRL